MKTFREKPCLLYATRLGLDEKNIFNLTGNHNAQCQNVNSPSTDQTESKHQLEKAHLINEQQKQEIAMLKQQISDFRDIINMLKKPEE